MILLLALTSFLATSVAILPAQDSRPPFPSGAASAVLSGRVRCDAPIRPAKLRLGPVQQKRFPAGIDDPDRRSSKDRGLAGVLVRVRGLEQRWQFGAPAEAAVLDFTQRWLPVGPRQQIAFPCPEDPPVDIAFDGALGAFSFRFAKNGAQRWRVRWTPKEPLDFVAGRDRRVVFKTPAAGRFSSPTHPWLRCNVVIVPHPFATVTGDEGEFTLPKLPRGDYEVVATHALLGERLERVRLTADKKITITLRVPEPLRAPDPKSGFAKARAAPELSWRFVGPGFVEYERQSAIEPASRRSTVSEAPQPACGFYTHEVVSGRRVDFGAYGLREVLAQVALSLAGGAPRARRRGRIDRVFESCDGLGRVRVHGTRQLVDVTRPDAVREQLRIELRSRAARSSQFAGRASIERVVDAARGLVVEFTAKLEGSWRDWSTPTGRLQDPWDLKLREAWRFVAFRPRRSARFKRRVNEAIARGEAYLAKHVVTWLGPKGRFKAKRDVQERDHGTGSLALVLLTLCKGNPNRDTAAVRALLAELRRRRPVDSYSLATCLLAFEALYEPPNEVEQLRQGLIERPRPRPVPAGDLAIMTDWTGRLLACRDPSSNKDVARFRYHGEASFDNSVTQFVALGLAAAARCRVKVPRGIWAGLARHFLAVQGPRSGKPRHVVLPSHRDLAAGTTRAAVRALPRGFGYQGPRHPYGSMTCAGITGLSVARSMIERQPALVAKIDRATQEAFAWLDAHYAVRGNPGFGRHWYYYALYSLERACELAAVARITDRDWYFDGGTQILAQQLGAGSWSGPTDVINTCFALLFLKKAVAPVITR